MIDTDGSGDLDLQELYLPTKPSHFTHASPHTLISRPHLMPSAHAVITNSHSFHPPTPPTPPTPPSYACGACATTREVEACSRTPACFKIG